MSSDPEDVFNVLWHQNQSREVEKARKKKKKSKMVKIKMEYPEYKEKNYLAS